jgi:regulatory protein
LAAERDPVEIAARALRHPDRSRHDVDEHLARAGVERDARADALDTLERIGYVDDLRFARTRAEALAGRGYGDQWIRHELARHGVDADTAAAAVGLLAPEAARAASVVQRLGAGRRTAAHLARKGFAEDAVETALAGEWQGEPPEL